MNAFTNKDLSAALQTTVSMIARCESAQPKFAEGTSQHTLLVNRLKALYVAQALLKGEGLPQNILANDLIKAQRPINSIIAKCETAQRKLAEESRFYARFGKMIRAMQIADALLSEEIEKREA